MEKLNFITGESYTLTQFGRKEGVNKIDIKKNAATGKHFFQFGGQTGAVSEPLMKAREAGEDVQILISKVQGTPSERNASGVFYLMHKQGEGGATVVGTFNINEL